MYKEEPFTKWEKKVIKTMVENGATKQGAEASRFALRKKKRVSQVTEKKSR
jgi:hypothetical protein